jgi:hypothetical protein
MKCSLAMLVLAGAVTALSVPSSESQAASVAQCQAACARFNPVDVPKTERWNVDRQHTICMNNCRVKH